jgi:protein TonB
MNAAARRVALSLSALALGLSPHLPAARAQAQAQKEDQPFQLAPVEITAPWILVPPSTKEAPKPAYPAGPRTRGEQGTVSVLIQVRADGSVGTVTVKKSSGNPALDEAAVTGVRSWTFVPARRGPNPVEHMVEVPVVFRLQ